MLTEQNILLANFLTASTVLISMSWKASITPTMGEWFYKIRNTFLISKLTAISKYRLGGLDAIEEFTQQWKPYVTLF